MVLLFYPSFSPHSLSIEVHPIERSAAICPVSPLIRPDGPPRTEDGDGNRFSGKGHKATPGDSSTFDPWDDILWPAKLSSARKHEAQEIFTPCSLAPWTASPPRVRRQTNLLTGDHLLERYSPEEPPAPTPLFSGFMFCASFSSGETGG